MSHHNRYVNVARMAGTGDFSPQPSIYDTLVECPVCSGAGSRMVRDDDGYERRELCPACEGAMWLTDEGYPYQPENDHD